MKLAIWILWPSFLVGAAGNAVFFTIFNPAELHAIWEPMPPESIAAYTLGFFSFWALCAASSAFTCFIQRGAHEVNRRMCALPNDLRPDGCRMKVRT